MDKQRQEFINEMKRMRDAIEKTKSEYLKNDYLKALKRMRKELKEYDEFRKSHVKMKVMK